MSKVFKQSPSFVPKEIITGKPRSNLGWRSVSIQENARPSSSDTIDESDTRQVLDEQDSSGTDSNESPESSHTPDFSSPDAPASFNEETLPPAPNDETELEPHPEPVDVELLEEEAYNQGLKDGLARAEEDFGSSTKALVMACRELNVLRDTILNNSMEEMQNLVLIIAEKIIRHSVLEQDRTIIDTVNEAIHQAVKSDEFVIQVNPDDLSVIKAKSKELLESVNGLENIIVHSDPSIERGGCKIDSSTSTVDATVASQLQIIENALKGKA